MHTMDKDFILKYLSEKVDETKSAAYMKRYNFDKEIDDLKECLLVSIKR